MKGAVRYINLRNAMAAVETEGGFTVIEALERCALDISDQVTGPLHSSGTEVLLNTTKRESFSVSIVCIRCNRVEALKAMGLT
jgi:hypothetical protein